MVCQPLFGPSHDLSGVPLSCVTPKHPQGWWIFPKAHLICGGLQLLSIYAWGVWWGGCADALQVTIPTTAVCDGNWGKFYWIQQMPWQLHISLPPLQQYHWLKQPCPAVHIHNISPRRQCITNTHFILNANLDIQTLWWQRLTVYLIPLTVFTNKYNNHALPPQHIKFLPAPHTISNDASIVRQKTY